MITKMQAIMFSPAVTMSPQAKEGLHAGGELDAVTCGGDNNDGEAVQNAFEVPRADFVLRSSDLPLSAVLEPAYRDGARIRQFT